MIAGSRSRVWKPSIWKPATGRRCSSCTGTSRARPAGGGSSPLSPGPTGYLALSLLGHGESGPAGDGHAPGADLAPFVAAFLVAVGVEAPLNLVGHSVGGAIALRLTLADPARIRTLTLVDSAGLGREVHPLLALDTLPGMLPVQRAHAAVKSLPHGRLSVFPDCGHLPHVEHPDRFAAVLGSWLTVPRDHPDNTPFAPSPSRARSKANDD